MAKIFLTNILFAIIWVVVNGQFTFVGFIFGFLIGMLALFLIREQLGSQAYFLKGWRILKLFFVFLYEIVLSAVRVARLVMSPSMNVKPALFAYELTVTEDWQITLLANLITLTPGTLSVDVSKDREILYIHVVNTDDLEAEKQAIRDGFERQILEISSR